jgi:hypothetical protein
MSIIETVKDHPYVAGGVALVFIVGMLKNRSSGGVSDSVQIAAINANKDISVSKIEAQKAIAVKQRDLIASTTQSRAQERVGLAVTNNDRVVDTSKIASDKTVGLSKIKHDFEGLLDTNSKVYALNTLQANIAERLGLGSQDVQRLDINRKAEVANRTVDATSKAAQLSYDLERQRLPWMAQIEGRKIDLATVEAQLGLLGRYDDNATNVTLAKKQLEAEKTRAISGLVSDVVVSGNQTASSVFDSFFGAVGDVFGGGGGSMLSFL